MKSIRLLSLVLVATVMTRSVVTVDGRGWVVIALDTSHHLFGRYDFENYQDHCWGHGSPNTSFLVW